MANLSIWKDLLAFIKNPDFNAFDSLSVKHRLIVIFKISIFTYISLRISSIPYSIFVNSNLIPPLQDNYLLELASISKSQPEAAKFYKIMTVLLSPVLIGMMFFNSQTKFNLRQIKISISLILAVLPINLTNKFPWYNSTFIISNLLVHAYIIFAGTVFYILLTPISPKLSKLENVWNSKFKHSFYLISLLFALMEIPRYLNASNSAISIILGLLPVFVYGIMFGYTRIRLGLVNSIVLYSIFLLFQIN